MWGAASPVMGMLRHLSRGATPSWGDYLKNCFFLVKGPKLGKTSPVPVVSANLKETFSEKMITPNMRSSFLNLAIKVKKTYPF